MKWVVLKVTMQNAGDLYAMVVQSGKIRMSVEAKSEVQIQIGDTLYPLRNALYCINGKTDKEIKIIKAEPCPKERHKTA